MHTNNFQSVPGLYQIQWLSGRLYIQFDHEKDTNPFSRRLTQAIIQMVPMINSSTDIKSVIFTGGINRSFCAGGDFNDVQKLKTESETFEYVSEIIDLYQAILRINKPTLSLIDKYAIGQGLQVALMTDYRIATVRAQISMPELKNGVACPLGATILEVNFGRSAMMSDVIECRMLSATEALDKKYFNRVTEVNDLLISGNDFLNQVEQYPTVPFQSTKVIYNQRMHGALESVRELACEAHVNTMLAQSAQAHFDRVLYGK